MQKFIFYFLVFFMLLSCDKNAIKQTTDSIKSADSLITKANEGFKTLDSISKKWNDSNGIAKKIIIPEIEKQRKIIDSTIKSGNYQIDSINKDLEKITKNIGKGTDVAKTLDSANKAIEKGENPIEVLTKTADKILKQTKTHSQNSQNNARNSSNNKVLIPPITEKYPLVKTAKIEIEVQNIEDAKLILKQKLRENNSDLVSENFSKSEGIEQEFLATKVPLENFDSLVNNLSNNVGNLKSKSIESEGIDYVSGQMCDVEITLVQTEKLANNATSTIEKNNKNADFYNEKSSNTFKIFENIMLAILPFWPLFLIAGLVWFFVRKNKKNKEKWEFEKQQILNQQKAQNNQKEKPEIAKTEGNTENEEPDYSKYLPKN